MISLMVIMILQCKILRLKKKLETEMHGVRLSLTILIATFTVLNFDTNYKLYDLALFIS